MSKTSITIAFPHGATPEPIIEPLLDALVPVGSLTMSASDDSRPARADALIVVDGWGTTALVRVPEYCQRYYGAPPLLAILHESPHSVREVLDSGFDYCTRWPIPPLDFAAAVRAALRRVGKHGGAPLIELDPTRLHIHCGRVEATLTKGQFGVLSELLRRPSCWVTSKELLAATSRIRRRDTQPIRRHILGLRRKLGTEAWRVRWHRSLGYSFDAASACKLTDPPASIGMTSACRK